MMGKLSVVWDNHMKNNSFGHHWIATGHELEGDP